MGYLQVHKVMRRAGSRWGARCGAGPGLYKRPGLPHALPFPPTARAVGLWRRSSFPPSSVCSPSRPHESPRLFASLTSVPHSFGLFFTQWTAVAHVIPRSAQCTQTLPILQTKLFRVRKVLKRAIHGGPLRVCRSPARTQPVLFPQHCEKKYSTFHRKRMNLGVYDPDGWWDKDVSL